MTALDNICVGMINTYVKAQCSDEYIFVRNQFQHFLVVILLQKVTDWNLQKFSSKSEPKILLTLESFGGAGFF